MLLQGKIVLVTGASEGIGREAAVQLADLGARVIAVSRHITTAPFHNDNIAEYDCDIRDFKAVDSLLRWVHHTYAGLDILINNAGIWHKVGQLEDISDETIADVIATNLVGTVNMTKRMLPLLRASDEAALVNVISKSGVVAQAGQSIYTATKYGVKGFTDVLREDLKDTNIHIMAVYQSGTNTDMFKKAGEEFSTHGFTEPADLAAAIITSLAGPSKFWVKELHVDRR